MKDITGQIKNAISQNVLWVVDYFIVMEKFKSNGYEISYWEDEENWATIFMGTYLIAYLWRKYPLIFVNVEYLKELTALLEEYDFMTIIESSDFLKKNLMIDSADLQIADGMSPKEFSVEDLWFYTNSR